MTDAMTLAFDLEAIEAMADPAAVFDDARSWSTYIGVISDKLGYQVVNYLRDHDVYDEDFFSRADKAASLNYLRSVLDTDRYVVIGCCGETADIARENGWEYLTLEEAAEAAGWTLSAEDIEHPLDQAGE